MLPGFFALLKVHAENGVLTLIAPKFQALVLGVCFKHWSGWITGSLEVQGLVPSLLVTWCK